jgi:4-aminobutyrate aminotransferase
MLHYCSSDFYHPVYSELCQRLAALAPVGGAPARVFLGNSGTEVVEAAIKLARHHTGRAHLVAFLGGFHGRTMGSLSLTASKARYRTGFGPLLPGVQHVPYGMAGLEQLQTQLFRHLVSPEEVAAIVVEPVQGEGGYVPAPDGFLAACGPSATSTASCSWPTRCRAGSAAPGSSGPSSTTASSRTSCWRARAWPAACPRRHHRPGRRHDVAGRHSTVPPSAATSVSARAALATIDLVESGLADAAAERGAQLLAGVQALMARQPLVEAVRGRGLMIGLDLADHDVAAALEQECFRRGLLVLTCGERSVRLAPPLVIRPDQVDTAVALLEDASPPSRGWSRRPSRESSRGPGSACTSSRAGHTVWPRRGRCPRRTGC